MPLRRVSQVGRGSPYGRASAHRITSGHDPADRAERSPIVRARSRGTSVADGKLPLAAFVDACDGPVYHSDPHTSPRRPAGARKSIRARNPSVECSPRSLIGLLLAARSPTPAFETLPCFGRPGLSWPTAGVVPRLVTTFALAVTSLASVTSRPLPLCTGQPARHSFRAASRDFPEQKGQASGYPWGRSVRSAAPSPQRLTGRPLRAAIMVGSSPAEIFRSSRRASARRPVRLSPGRKLPTPAGLSEPRSRSRPGPPGRDLRARMPAHPLRIVTASLRGHSTLEAPARGMSLSPRFGPLSRSYDLHRVECWILVPDTDRALASNKPPSSWTSESPRIQL